MKGFKITEPNDVIKQLKEHRDNYNERGVYLGFEKIDEYYSMQFLTPIASITICEGNPNLSFHPT